MDVSIPFFYHINLKQWAQTTPKLIKKKLKQFHL